jgi:hypothetical protein
VVNKKKGAKSESWANMRLKTLIRENCANINNGYGVDVIVLPYNFGWVAIAKGQGPNIAPNEYGCRIWLS